MFGRLLWILRVSESLARIFHQKNIAEIGDLKFRRYAGGKGDDMFMNEFVKNFLVAEYQKNKTAKRYGRFYFCKMNFEFSES